MVFLPNSNDGKKCEPSGAMSSFGYLSFVLSLINAAVNAANNVNNNQVKTKIPHTMYLPITTVSSGTVQPDICYDKLKGQLRN